MIEPKELTWGEIKEIMKSHGMKDSDVIDDIGYYGYPTSPEKAMVHREKLKDGKYHVTLTFRE